MAALSSPASAAPPASVTSATGALDTLEKVFRSLCRGPAARLVLPGRMFAPGRRRPVRLVEARELLLWPGRMDPDRRDAVWAVLVRRAQTGDPAWIVGTAGVLAPGLRRVVDRLSAGFAGDRDDLEAEVLAGFLTALHTVDPDSGRLPSRLCWAGYRAGLTLRHRDAEPQSTEQPFTSAAWLTGKCLLTCDDGFSEDPTSVGQGGTPGEIIAAVAAGGSQVRR